MMFESDEDLKTYLKYSFKWWRNKRNISQLQLSIEIDKNIKSISRWESGETVPDVISFYDLLFFYGIDSEQFLFIPMSDFNEKTNLGLIKKSNNL